MAMEETRKYKQTELGLLPEDWVERKLGDVEIKSGSMLKSTQYEHGQVPVIAGGKVPAGYHSTYNRQANTITISASGASAGYISFYTCPIFASDCSTINEQDGIDVRYLYFSLRLKQSEIYKCQAGGAQPHIHAKDIKDIVVPLPEDINEQRRIASALTSIDNLLDSLDRLIAKKRDIKQGAMQQLLTGKTRLKGFSEPWVENTLGEVALFKAGKSLSKTELQEQGDYPCYGGNGIRTYLPIYSHDGEYSIVGGQGELCGNVVYAIGKFYATEHAVVVYPNEIVHNRFIYYLLTQIGH